MIENILIHIIPVTLYGTHFIYNHINSHIAIQKVIIYFNVWMNNYNAKCPCCTWIYVVLSPGMQTVQHHRSTYPHQRVQWNTNYSSESPSSDQGPDATQRIITPQTSSGPRVWYHGNTPHETCSDANDVWQAYRKRTLLLLCRRGTCS